MLTAEAQPEQQAANATNLTTTATQEDNPAVNCPLVTIAKGLHSGWGHDRPEFAGADLVIKDPDAWMAFWHRHTGEPADPPPVNFQQRVVIATIMGPQPTSGGPNTAIVRLRTADALARIVVIDDRRPGPAEQNSNPFHIVSVCRERLPGGRSVCFVHRRPLPGSGALIGRVFADPPDGEPMPLFDSLVTLEREGSEPRQTTTGRDGSYFFVNVVPGEYLLRAQHPGFEPVAVSIEIPPDTLVHHPFFLMPVPDQPGALVGGVRGVIDDGHQIPIVEASVRLFAPDGQPVGQTFTNCDGHFAIYPVPPGVFTAVANAPDWLPTEAEVEIHPGEPTHHLFLLHQP
jgi:hypothetical protein